MKYSDKNVLIFLLAAFAFLPLLTLAHTANSALVPPDVKQSPLKLQLGRDTNQAVSGRCIKWKTHCYKKRYCQPYYGQLCYVCRKYKSYGNYQYRRTCNINTVQNYRTKEYWCYQVYHYTGKCNYFYKKSCTSYCVKQVF